MISDLHASTQSCPVHSLDPKGPLMHSDRNILRIKMQIQCKTHTIVGPRAICSSPRSDE